jgi:nucleotide-binding universal stress UspA family protein
MEGPIVVGTDGSDTATVALMEAVKLAELYETELHIVSAYKRMGVDAASLPGEFKGAVTSTSAVDAVLADAASRAKSSGVTAWTHAVDGDPADALIDTARKVSAGLLVVGNKGIGSVKRFVLGNVPSKVVHNAPCSTQIVHTT